jgi:transposase
MESRHSLAFGRVPGSDPMQVPEAVAAMLRLKALGWGSKRIAEALGCSRTTVKRYLRQGGWEPYRSRPPRGALRGLEPWLKERFLRHRGNADVVRQELQREHGIQVSLRTVERAVSGYRREVSALARATVRFETPPGKQLQIDFGETRIEVGNERPRVFLFVATLGYSRRPYVAAFLNEAQASWLAGIEGAFRHFNGVPEELLLDNPRALVSRHDARTRTVTFNPKFLAFSRHWGFRPKACAPYRARTKGKDESGVGYVKRNAIAGRRFESWHALEAHLAEWQREIADQRIHGTTGERPIDRFTREEASALRSINARPSFVAVRELSRRVQSDACVEVDTNAYSVPWRLIGAWCGSRSPAITCASSTPRPRLRGIRTPWAAGNASSIASTLPASSGLGPDVLRNGRCCVPCASTHWPAVPHDPRR